MGMPPMGRLVNVALYTAVGGITGILYLTQSKVNEVSQSEYFKEAFKVLRAHEGAAQYLGEPIKQLGFRPDNEDNWCNGKQAQYHVRVKGTKDNGIIYFWATTGDDGKWNINRLELELTSQPNHRLLVKDGPMTS